MSRLIIHALAPLALFLTLAFPQASFATPDAPPQAGARFDTVEIEPTKTSIYVGSVSLTMPPFVRQDDVYRSSYQAKVFPFFIFNEHGSISIDFPDDSLRRLRQGEVVYFKGHATNSRGDGRRIEGRAVPDAPDADHGRIKVRVWVGRVELIFNTTYRFTGPV